MSLWAVYVSSDGFRTGKGGEGESILGFVYRLSPFFLNISLNGFLLRQRECMNERKGPEKGRRKSGCKHSYPLQNPFLRI
jgi:hypothetical protein